MTTIYSEDFAEKIKSDSIIFLPQAKNLNLKETQCIYFVYFLNEWNKWIHHDWEISFKIHNIDEFTNILSFNNIEKSERNKSSDKYIKNFFSKVFNSFNWVIIPYNISYIIWLNVHYSNKKLIEKYCEKNFKYFETKYNINEEFIDDISFLRCIKDFEGFVIAKM